MMKKSVRILSLLLALLLMLALTGCNAADHRKKAYVNNYLQGVETFSFGTEAENEGVHTVGTIYAQKNPKENDANATITLHMKRGESHGEGISIYIAKGWFVNSVLSNFPTDASLDEKFDIATIVKTADAGSEWAYIVEVGCDRNMDIPDGTEGDVVIDMMWDYKSVGPDSFKTIAAVGAGYAGGTEANGKTAVRIEIPLE